MRAELFRLARQVERVEAKVEGLEDKIEALQRECREGEERLQEALEAQTKRLEDALDEKLPSADFGIYRLIIWGVGAAILIALIPGLASTLVPALFKLVPIR